MHSPKTFSAPGLIDQLNLLQYLTKLNPLLFSFER